MHHLKFFTLLRTLDEKKIASFSGYLRRLHGNERIALSLFAYILKFYPAFHDEKKLHMDYAYKKVFKKEIGGDRKKVLNSLSDLHSWLKCFLLTEKATTASFENQALWLAILWEHGLEAEFSRQFPQLQAETNTSPEISATQCLKEMAVNHFMCYYLKSNTLDSDGNAIQQYEDSLDVFYVITKFKIACEKANRKNVLSLTLKPEVSLSIIDFSGTHVYDRHPLLILYREVYQLIALHQEESYDRIEANLTEYSAKVAPAELHRIMSYLYNYASSQIRQGRSEFWEKTHWLNKFGVEHAVFLREGGMSVTQFNNIVSIACNMQDVEWASSFVQSQSHFLPAPLRKDATLLAEATIFFKKKEYGKVLRILEKKEFKDLLDNIRSKALVLRAWYELGDIDERLWDLCSVFEAFLQRQGRKKIEAVTASLNFTRILKLLVRENAVKNKIVHEIETMHPIYFKSWLMEKVKNYKNHKL